MGITVAILLTMWRSPERQSLYATRIQWWKEHVQAPDGLFLVDSYGNLPNSSNVLSFNQSLHFTPQQQHSSSTYELYALAFVLDAWKSEFQKFTYVFKVTCKYVVPKLLRWIHNANPSTSLVLQHYYGSEVIGFRTRDMVQIVSNLTALNRVQCCIEDAVRAIKSFHSITQMPPMNSLLLLCS